MFIMKENLDANNDQPTTWRRKLESLHKPPVDKKDQGSLDLESLQIVLQKLSNEFIDMIKIQVKGHSNKDITNLLLAGLINPC